MVGLIQPGRLSSALCLHVTDPTNQLDYRFNSCRFKGEQKASLLILSFTELLLQAYEEQCGILLSRIRCKPT